MSKAQLRKKGLSRRHLGYSPSLSAQICDKAATLSAFSEASSVMLYLSTGSEVNTSRLLALCRKYGKTVSAPKVINSTEMKTSVLDENGFVRGAFGIWEPTGNTPAKPDIIFVPGVVFDKSGNRIGYGKGYYDRFLKRCKAITVGLAFHCQLVPEIPAEPEDIPLDIILTEEGVYA